MYIINRFMKPIMHGDREHSLIPSPHVHRT